MDGEGALRAATDEDGAGAGRFGGMSYRMSMRSKCLRRREPTDGCGACSRTVDVQRAGCRREVDAVIKTRAK